MSDLWLIVRIINTMRSRLVTEHENMYVIVDLMLQAVERVVNSVFISNKVRQVT